MTNNKMIRCGLVSILISKVIIFITTFLVSTLVSADPNSKLRQTNLLLIMFDDLRPQLSVYGKDYMITPNFERLAKRSVIFDYAFSQVAVCNPSRDSLLTGLRPDTLGNYNFQRSFWGHLPLPTQLIRSGYNTAGIGKILHWDGKNKDIWSFDQYDNDWYGYQGSEDSFMNSSTMPDKVRPEHKFRDHEFAQKSIQILHKIVKEPKYFMMGVGFKLPHLALHIPYDFYKLYNDKSKKEAWKLSKKELRFPPSVSEVSYRCCAGSLNFMREEGAKRANRTVHLGDINVPFSNEMYDELMMGYCAGVTFVDKQVGKLLDEMDRLNLWENTTVILTADHGMHNGEKGLWLINIKSSITKI
jgi:arylsulfatase A-like enzyme